MEVSTDACVDTVPTRSTRAIITSPERSHLVAGASLAKTSVYPRRLGRTEHQKSIGLGCRITKGVDLASIRLYFGQKALTIPPNKASRRKVTKELRRIAMIFRKTGTSSRRVSPTDHAGAPVPQKKYDGREGYLWGVGAAIDRRVSANAIARRIAVTKAPFGNQCYPRCAHELATVVGPSY